MKSPLKHWKIVRILLFIVIGAMNTVFIKPEDIGTWKNYLGYFVLLIAAAEILFLINQYLKSIKNEK